MKQDKTTSNHNGKSRQESCPECNGEQTFFSKVPQSSKNSHNKCPQCGTKRWLEFTESLGDEDSLQPRTIYVSETYFLELTEKQERRGVSEEQQAETKRTFSDPGLFEARVEEIMKDLEKKAPLVLSDCDGDDEPNEAKEEVEEME